MIYKILPSSAVGTVNAPPSKSMAHRLLICAGLSEGKSVVRGISQSKDVLATIDCLKSFGAEISINGGNVTVEGINKKSIIDNPILQCNESGSTIRFFVPIALAFGKKTRLYGKNSLLKRPMDIYKDLASNHGFDFFQTENYLEVNRKLKNGIYTVPGNVSSQFITGLLFALPLIEGDSIIRIIPPIESYSYLKLTLSALKKFGIEVSEKNNSFHIEGNQQYIPQDCIVEGDYSNAAFLDGFNCIGGCVTVTGLNDSSLQGDKIYKDYFPLLENSAPTLDISDCPDLGPVLFAIAAAKNGGIFTGVKRLRIKESDRVATMAQELSKFGIEIIIEDNRVIIPKSKLKAPEVSICGHNDHRIVMATSLLLSLTGGEIEGAEAVSKSYPDYFEAIRSLGIGVEKIESDYR